MSDIEHYVRRLRRIITLIAVIFAVPVIVWTISGFIRPPHNLLGTAFNHASGRTAANLADPQERGAVETEKVAEQSADDTSSALAAMSNSAMPMVADAAQDMPLPLPANDATADRSDPKAAMGPASAIEAEAHAISASTPLPGPILLPRPRPHNAGTTRTAETSLSRMPMPRPRPVADGAGHGD